MFVENLYKKLEGQSITGKTKTQFRARSAQECSLRCCYDTECDACQYKATGPGNCLLIVLEHDLETFIAEELIHIYKREPQSLQPHNLEQTKKGPEEPLELTTSPLELHQWAQPPAWTGSLPVIYRSFDTLDDLILMRRNNEENFNALVSGQVNNAIRTNRVNRQWLDLGDMSTSYMMTGTCMSQGGAVSLWMRVFDCPATGGIISSFTQGKSIFRIRCGGGYIWYELVLYDGFFFFKDDVPGDWTHVVVNYIGPGGGATQGIFVYYNGESEGDDTSKVSLALQTGNGRVFVRQHMPEEDQDYAGVEVDELLVFNNNLDGDLINAIYNQQN